MLEAKKPLFARIFKALLNLPESLVDWYDSFPDRNRPLQLTINYKSKIIANNLNVLDTLLTQNNIPINRVMSNPNTNLGYEDSTLRGKIETLFYNISLKPKKNSFGLPTKPELEVDIFFKSSDFVYFRKIINVINCYVDGNIDYELLIVDNNHKLESASLYIKKILEDENQAA